MTFLPFLPPLSSRSPVVTIVQAYLSKAGDEVVAGGHLLPLLGVFQKLIASKAHDHEGFDLLNAMVESLPLSAYESYLPTVCTLLFSRFVHQGIEWAGGWKAWNRFGMLIAP